MDLYSNEKKKIRALCFFAFQSPSTLYIGYLIPWSSADNFRCILILAKRTGLKCSFQWLVGRREGAHDFDHSNQINDGKKHGTERSKGGEEQGVGEPVSLSIFLQNGDQGRGNDRPDQGCWNQTEHNEIPSSQLRRQRGMRLSYLEAKRLCEVLHTIIFRFFENIFHWYFARRHSLRIRD